VIGKNDSVMRAGELTAIYGKIAKNTGKIGVFGTKSQKTQEILWKSPVLG
jgi:hypothetical protein